MVFHCLRESPGFQVNLVVKRLILDTGLTYYCLNVWCLMYFSIIIFVECNKNLGRSYTCKVLGFLSQLMSKICIKSSKTLEKSQKSLGRGEACNQTENVVFTICNTEIEKLDLGTRRPQWVGLEPLQLLIQSKICFRTINLDHNYNKVSLVLFKEAHIRKITLYHNFNENRKFEMLAYFGGIKFQIVLYMQVQDANEAENRVRSSFLNIALL